MYSPALVKQDDRKSCLDDTVAYVGEASRNQYRRHILVERDGQDIAHVFPEIKLHLFTIVVKQFFMRNNGNEAHCGISVYFPLRNRARKHSQAKMTE